MLSLEIEKMLNPITDPPFAIGDEVMCVQDSQPDYYIHNWTQRDNIHSGDKLTVTDIEYSFIDGWGWHVWFNGKQLFHSSNLFRHVQ